MCSANGARAAARREGPATPTEVIVEDELEVVLAPDPGPVRSPIKPTAKPPERQSFRFYDYYRVSVGDKEEDNWDDPDPQIEDQHMMASYQLLDSFCCSRPGCAVDRACKPVGAYLLE